MRLERFYTVLGVFAGGAIILSFFTAVFFYDVYVRQKEDSYVMFFNGSLEGLNATSNITYNGVKIGEVKLIEITVNEARDDIRIPVYVQFFIDDRYKHAKPIQILIKQGYVANIKKPNLITGVSSIELIKADKPRQFTLKQYHGYVIFPTKNKTEDDVSLDDTLKAAKKTFEDLSAFIKSPKLQETIRDIKILSDSLNHFTLDLDQQLPQTLSTFSRTLINISNSANSLQNLIDYLSRNPESLLRGKQ
jgi:ABC-type transporter Mla subunit MlaD